MCIIRFICHYISGVTIRKGYCTEGMAIELVLTVVGLIAVENFINLDKKNLI